ncbi:MAG: YdeI/OmpD-associated family protein [Pseudomonadota bacterium]
MSQQAADFEQVAVASDADLWAWLAANHSRDTSVWLVTWKASQRDKYVSRDAVLDALIAYGWVDGRRMKLDDDRTMQLISPRREQIWAQTYKDRAARLEQDGRMEEPGRAAIRLAKESGKWDARADVDALLEPDDLVAALKSRAAKAWWDGAAPSYRRNILRWIASAKRPETRGKRIMIAADHAARGEKVPQY